MDTSRLYDLFDRYTTGALTEPEKLELAAWVIDPANEQALAELEARYWEQLKDVADPLPERAERSLRAILPAPVVPLRRKLLKVAFAACVVLLVGLGAWFAFFRQSGQEKPVAKQDLPQDVKAPEANRATITLAGGKTIYLDSAGNGQLAMQNNVKIIKTADGEIAYSGVVQGETIYNTLYNPRGSKVQTMKLSDGTQVWLNAGSSLTYPVAFAGSDRKVSITGEAYFEVAHDANKPFYVNKGDVQVQVLGTHFNVNAYDDEDDIKVTLLEGSVKTSIGMASRILKPGEQVRIDNDIKVVKGIDTDAVIAWKNGLFSFSQSDLKTIMRQVARWYDVEVSYEGPVTDRRFGGEISRMSNVSGVMKVLSESGIKYKIEDRKIIITR